MSTTRRSGVEQQLSNLETGVQVLVLTTFFFVKLKVEVSACNSFMILRLLLSPILFLIEILNLYLPLLLLGHLIPRHY